MDFVKSLESARQVPDDADPVFNPFEPPAAPAEPRDELVDTSPDPGRIAGVPAYPSMKYFCRRFYMGRELREIIDNAKYFDDRDESAELQAIMDKKLQGKAIILSRKEAILGEGSVVIWLEWCEKIPTPASTKKKDHLTLEQLRSREPMNTREEFPGEEAEPNEQDDW